MTTALILGAAVWENGPSPTLRRRTHHAAQLYHNGHVTHIVACGGLGQHPPTEAEAMRQLLLEVDVPDQAIQCEMQSTTTEENIRFALPILKEQSVLIVSDWYHIPRAKLVARRLGLNAKGSAAQKRGAKIWPQTKGALREIPAYALYFIKIRRA